MINCEYHQISTLPRLESCVKYKIYLEKEILQIQENLNSIIEAPVLLLKTVMVFTPLYTIKMPDPGLNFLCSSLNLLLKFYALILA